MPTLQTDINAVNTVENAGREKVKHLIFPEKTGFPIARLRSNLESSQGENAIVPMPRRAAFIRYTEKKTTRISTPGTSERRDTKNNVSANFVLPKIITNSFMTPTNTQLILHRLTNCFYISQRKYIILLSAFWSSYSEIHLPRTTRYLVSQYLSESAGRAARFLR
jgi:hypothetical protein